MTAILFLFYCIQVENRKRIIIIDTGINNRESLRGFLCRDGHRSFLENNNWIRDRSGHGLF